MSQDKNPAPHTCGDCGEPAYHGFNVPGKCVQRGCHFYDAGLWADWVMWLPDVEDPVDDFEDEDTNPGVPMLGLPRTYSKPHHRGTPSGFGTPLLVDPNGATKDRQLDAVGQLLGLPRGDGPGPDGTRIPESDDDYRERLTDFYRKAP